MPNLRIRQADIDSLSRKLDEISDVLSPEERGLFLAIFKLASATLGGGATGGSSSQTESGRLGGGMPPLPTSGSIASGTLPRLSSGFRDAFQPVLGSRFGGANPAGLDIDVHVGW
jgi:hypothetical protein